MHTSLITPLVLVPHHHHHASEAMAISPKDLAWDSFYSFHFILTIHYICDFNYHVGISIPDFSFKL